MQAQAWFRGFSRWRKSTCAGANREEFLYQLDSGIDDAPTAERAEVPRTISGNLPGGIDTWKIMLYIDLNKWIKLIVPQLHVIVWLQLFNELGFDQQCLQFRTQNAKLNLFDILEQSIHFTCIAQRLTVIR